jgi:hypothetical protein
VLRVADRGLREGILQGLTGHTLEAALGDRPEPMAPVWQAHRLAVGGTPA